MTRPDEPASAEEVYGEWLNRETDDTQPWMPPGAWVPKIGDRVQIRLSAECRENWGHEEIVEAHPDWADGVTGVVDSVGLPSDHMMCDSAASLRRHPYLIRLDVDGPGGSWGLWMAASELIPLEGAL